MLKCPYPECHHTGDLITNVHCKQAHGMNKNDVFHRYGQPKKVEVDMKKREQNFRFSSEKQEERFYQAPPTAIIRKKMKGLHKSNA